MYVSMGDSGGTIYFSTAYHGFHLFRERVHCVSREIFLSFTDVSTLLEREHSRR